MTLHVAIHEDEEEEAEGKHRAVERCQKSCGGRMCWHSANAVSGTHDG